MTEPIRIGKPFVEVVGGSLDGLRPDAVATDAMIDAHQEHLGGWLGDAFDPEALEFDVTLERTFVRCPGYGDDLCAQSQGLDPFEDGCGLCTLGSSA